MLGPGSEISEWAGVQSRCFIHEYPIRSHFFYSFNQYTFFLSSYNVPGPGARFSEGQGTQTDKGLSPKELPESREEANMQVLHLPKDSPSAPLWRRSNLLLVFQVLTEKGLHHPSAQTNKSSTHGDVCISFLGYLEPPESTEGCAGPQNGHSTHTSVLVPSPTPLLPPNIHNPLPWPQ